MIALILSIIFPGLGQFYYGKNARGLFMLLLGITPLYPIALVWSVIDVIKLNKQGLTPQYEKKEAIWAILLFFVIIPACFFVLIFGSISLWTWYQNNYILKREILQEGTSIAAAIEKYHYDLGHYPSNVSALISGKPVRSEWYTDNWSQPYYYRVSSNGNNYILISKGRDRTLGTQDDIIFKQ